MIQLRSILEVADNTGARKAAMISKKGQITTTAGVGDVITVHIKSSATEATVKKGEVAKAVVVRTKAPGPPCGWQLSAFRQQCHRHHRRHQ